LSRRVLALSLLLASCSHADTHQAANSRLSLEDYRGFRATAIDLLGRAPNRAEVAELEKPDFKLDTWIDAHLTGAQYASRLTRVYMDLLRLDANTNFGMMPWQLYRVEVQGPDGPVYVYYRENQRRSDENVDGEFCLSPDDTGQIIRPRQQPVGTAKKVSKESLEHATVVVKPWWLYRDYKAESPHDLYGDTWKPGAEYKLSETLLKEPDRSATKEIRICREEAQARDTGHIYASGRTKLPPKPKDANGEKEKGKKEKPKPGELPPGGRYRPAPLDKPYATEHKGDAVSCATRLALDMSIDCGCGVALERCMPSDGDGQNSAGFYFPNHEPLGETQPLDSARQPAQRWFPYWWSREAVHFFDDLFANDEDFRLVLTGKSTLLNGPLAQFYKSVQRSNCCGPEVSFGMTEEKEPLFNPAKVPDLQPSDVSVWKKVADRGPHAAGILTMPVFLEKYASARSRAAALYSVFLCKSFVSDSAKLEPSTEPNLMIRPGCSNCHATLEPLAAYFARIEPSTFTFLPTSEFPAKNPTCKKDAKGKLNASCNALYDVAFTDDAGAVLRSAYGSPQHADEAATGAGKDIVAMPEFASCAVERVASSFLGRPTTPEDAPLLEKLTSDFKASGYKIKTIVRGVLLSDAYRHANDLSSNAGGKQ